LTSNPIIRQKAVTSNDRVVDKPRDLNHIPINNLVIHENDIPGPPMEEDEDDGIEDQNANLGRADRIVRNHNQREDDQNRDRDRDDDINNPWFNNNTPTDDNKRQMHNDQFDIEVFETLIRKHEYDCKKVVKNGKLLLVLTDAAAEAARNDGSVSITENMSEHDYNDLFGALRVSLSINQAQHMPRPRFHNVKHADNKWFINMNTNTSEQAIFLLDPAKRKGLRGLGSLNWFFPASIGTKIMLNKLKRKGLINGWHLSRKGARIVLDLKKFNQNDNQFYVIKSPVEVSGLLSIATSAKHLNKLVNSTKTFYTRDKVTKRNEELVRQVADEPDDI